MRPGSSKRDSDHVELQHVLDLKTDSLLGVLIQTHVVSCNLAFLECSISTKDFQEKLMKFVGSP